MAAVLGNLSTTKASTTLGGTYDSLSGIKSASLSTSIDNLYTTDFDYGVDRTSLYGLRGRKLSLSGEAEVTSTGMAKVKTAVEASPPTSVFFEFLPNGTAGHKGEFLIDSFEVSSEVDGLVQISIEATLTGALTAV